LGEEEENGEDSGSDSGPVKRHTVGSGLFINPLLVVHEDKKSKKRQKLDKDDVSEGEWSEDDQDKAALKKELDTNNKKQDKLLGKRKKREADPDAAADFFHNDGFEEVPQEKIAEGYSSMDSDDMAETRAIAKLMLRKKNRREILDSTYNRYTNFDDPAMIPQWFAEDEAKHYKPNVPITKA
jgi:AdoMet-dependent rRNA methyltransferase SPB1